MAIKVLGISTSPRRGGNSDILLKEALKTAGEAGAHVEYVNLQDLNIEPCYGCGYCDRKGVCRVKDDFPALMARMLKADILIFATPIYFMGVCAWGKMVIDRCQCLWAKKHVRNERVRDADRDWAAMVIAVGGSKSKKMFDAIDLTMKYFLETMDINIIERAYYNRVDDKGVIADRPGAIEETKAKAERLVKTMRKVRGNA